MKGIVNVSIAGIAFKLDEAAYTRLNDYLRQIRGSYGDSPEGEEIVSDLEARIAEIILTRQNASVIVPLALVDEALAQLGAPEEISGGEGTASSATDGPTTSAPSSAFGGAIAHRLYRNPDGAKLGGVCSGLGAYFNVDPALVRLIFAAPLVLMIFFFILHWDHLGRIMTGLMTSSFILYPLLWIVIPKAKTPLQKLEMQGEKITREKLEQTFRAEFERRGNAPQHIEQRARSARNASVFSEIVSIFGRIVLFFIKAVVAIVGFAFIIAAVAIIAAVGAVLIGGTGAVVSGLTATSPVLIVVLLCLAVLIPLIFAVYGILKFLFGFSHNKPLLTTMMVIWLLTLAFGTVILIKDFDNIRFSDNFHIGWLDHEDGNGRVTRTSGWTDGEEGAAETVYPLTLTADTLFVAPAQGVTLPEGFVLKLRGSDTTRYAEPSLVVRTREGTNPKLEYTLQGDTLYLHTPRPEASEVNLCLPEKTVVVAPGINTNEYYERINE